MRGFGEWTRARRTRRDDAVVPDVTRVLDAPPVDIDPDDPALAHFRAAGGAVDLDQVSVDSPAIRALRDAGVRLVVPLLTQGELVGLVNLGPRLSEQDYTTDDRRLLERLAGQAAPALQVAQMVRAQEADAAERERIAQELRVATLIQQHFLPRELPRPTGWSIAAFYRPAREVGGDFYDFVALDDDRLGVFTGDVTDKGVPAALVMAATRAVLRTAATDLHDPGAVLARVNDLLVPDMPARMFVTCLYGILDLSAGTFRFANAGHNLPCVARGGRADEARATGMPLGMFPGSVYDEAELRLDCEDTLLLYSDALPEAHGPDASMYGFPRVVDRVATGPGGAELIDHLLADLQRFTGPDWDQEDDITLVTIRRDGVDESRAAPDPQRRLLASFTVPSRTGSERQALARLDAALDDVPLSSARRERLRTAVAESTMNAIEHGNRERPDLDVELEVFAEPAALLVRIHDHGEGSGPPTEFAVPDLEAKLRGEQPTRGWGMFLVEQMVDGVNVYADGARHTVELVMALTEEP